ncbi:MAG: ABC transporter permease [Clostridia bacterium]|nr:ABC transporter permease [Clostridia bacterium]
MRTASAFIKRNFKEMLRDPLVYVFCLGFPLVMIILFQIINKFTAGNTPMFDATSLIPGIMMFSFTFVMLTAALLVSKDRTTAFLIRLYTSPMRTADFVLGYAAPCFLVGIGQEVVCIFAGWIVSLIVGGAYFSFGAAMLLMIEMLPMLLICLSFGILFGSLLNDKSAPAIVSVFISMAGILGGCWMPLDAMGGFETFCRFLPFYPSVYIGRVITGATHSFPDPVSGGAAVYSFDSVAKLGFIPIALFLLVGAVFAIVAFRANMKSDKK